MKIELGACDKRDGWLTVDRSEGCDINHDLSTTLPFDDDSIEQIYSSHLLEHFYFPDLHKLLLECYRVLVPNGIFEAAVPNMRPYIEAYFKPEGSFVFPHDIDTNTFHYFSKIDLINYMGSLDGAHRFMFDNENLPLIIKNVGFKNVKMRKFKENLDLPHRKNESIYVEAIKGE